MSQTVTSLHNAAHSTIQDLSSELLVSGMTFGTAESCTGGLIAALCTDISGSSAWFSGAIISYANQVKERVLHVPSTVLKTYGAVSKETVLRMAQGAVEVLQVDIAIAVSGIAGPSGGTTEKPVGTVWLGLCMPSNNEPLHSKHLLLTGNREQIRMLAAIKALEFTKQVLSGRHWVC